MNDILNYKTLLILMFCDLYLHNGDVEDIAPLRAITEIANTKYSISKNRKRITRKYTK